MKERKPLSDLTIGDDFMFSAVMTDPENCKGLLELILQVRIDRVVVETEKNFIYHPEHHGVRLDVFVADGNNTRYDVEIQMSKKPDLARRSRYYHGEIDMELLRPNVNYNNLPDAYVIFICSFDPIGLGRYRYTYQMRCSEDTDNMLGDGIYTIFLSTKGKNDSEVPEPLVKFLHYVAADLEESTKSFDDDFVSSLQEAVAGIKDSIHFGRQYMLLEEIRREEYEKGKAEGKAEGQSEGKAEYLAYALRSKGEVPERILKMISNEKDTAVLDRWMVLALKAGSVEEFIAQVS